jgi:hypothetical protein
MKDPAACEMETPGTRPCDFNLHREIHTTIGEDRRGDRQKGDQVLQAHHVASQDAHNSRSP